MIFQAVILWGIPTCRILTGYVAKQHEMTTREAFFGRSGLNAAGYVSSCCVACQSGENKKGEWASHSPFLYIFRLSRHYQDLFLGEFFTTDTRKAKEADAEEGYRGGFGNGLDV
jgi:hypothetical protein